MNAITMTDKTAETITRMTADGWKVASQGSDGIQFTKPKRYRNDFALAGILLLIVYGLGLVILLLGAVDYMMAKDETRFLTREELRAGLPDPAPKRRFWRKG